MVEEPEEFVNLALDTVDKQSSEVPKTAAAQLLEMLCDHIDGSTSFIAQLCAMVVNHAVAVLGGQGDSIGDPNSPYHILKELQPRYFFTRMGPVQRIEACLVVVTVMSYLLSRRSDLIALLEDLLSKNFAFFADPALDPLVTVRLCLFIGYYCDNLFKAQAATVNLQQYIQVRSALHCTPFLLRS